MTVRARAVAAIAVLAAASFVGAVAPAPASAAGERVAIIVGPSGGVSNTYRSMANEVAAAATAAGATVVKVYSPNATWANVRAAVAGAHVIVYFGHGNGYPNPYGSTELTDRTNGWGLNRTTTNGDGDNWTSTLAYCGEKALLGTLTASDGTVQWNYCGGKTNTDGISPAPGFVMVYAQAHYAPGFGERYQTSDPKPTLTEAQQRVRNYSYPVFARGASGYFATALGDADRIVSSVIRQRTTTYADIFRAGSGYSSTALRTTAHPDVAGAQIWVQATRAGASMHFNDPDYWYAYAGDPNRTFAGTAPPPPPLANPDDANFSPAVPLSFRRGTHTGYRFDGAGRMLALKTGTLPSNSSASTSMRRVLAGQSGRWYYVTNGIWAGYWLRESAGLYLSGGPAVTVDLTHADYSPARRLNFRVGTHTGYAFNSAGSVTGSKSGTLTRDSSASTSMRRTFTNQTGSWFYVTNGIWAGYWVRSSDVVYTP